MAAKSQDQSQTRWDDVRIFLAAYRHRTLGVAAKKLGVDTSTTSRRLTAFESGLGAQLFERGRDGLTPTRAAELLLPAAEAMEAAHGRLTRDASDLEAAAEGVVRLSVAPGFADTFIAPMLGRLRQQHPGIRIELDASVRPVDLTRHEADLAIRSVAPAGADLLATKLAEARWLVAGSPALVKHLGRLKAWEEAPWITWDRDLASFPPARWVTEHAPRADIVLRTSHFTSQCAAARTGLGVLLVPEPYLQAYGFVPAAYTRELEASRARLPVDGLWLVGHRALRSVPRVAAVWSFLLREIRGDD